MNKLEAGAGVPTIDRPTVKEKKLMELILDSVREVAEDDDEIGCHLQIGEDVVTNSDEKRKDRHQERKETKKKEDERKKAPGDEQIIVQNNSTSD